jgi:YkoY family integral membrane protein
VIAVMVLGLPRRAHKQALTYGLVGAFVLRLIATGLAVYLIHVTWVKLAGGLYLLYLTIEHFRHPADDTGARPAPAAKPMFGLSQLWSTVVRVELVNLAFSVDSILVAVAMSNKFWVILTGGLLGIAAMRVVVGQVIKVIQRYPALVDGAFVIIAWVGLKLLLDYGHQLNWITWEVAQPVSLGIISVIMAAAYAYARKAGPRVSKEPPEENT